MRIQCSVGKTSGYPQSTDVRSQTPQDSSDFDKTKQNRISQHMKQPGLIGLVYFENASMASSDRPPTCRLPLTALTHRETGARSNRLQRPFRGHLSWPWFFEDVCAFPFSFIPPQVHFMPVYQPCPFHPLFLVLLSFNMFSDFVQWCFNVTDTGNCLFTHIGTMLAFLIVWYHSLLHFNFNYLNPCCYNGIVTVLDGYR